MEENVPLPKINKIPFIILDVILVLIALIIAFSSEGPLTPMRFFWVITSVTLGGVVACMPFYVEFRTLSKLKEYDLSQANTENARRIEAALMGIQEIGENVAHNTDRNAEVVATLGELLDQMDRRISEIKAGPHATAEISPEQLQDALSEQFNAARDTFARAIAEQVSISSDKQHDKLNSALSKLQGLPMQVNLLGELAGRYQGLAAMISDTAAQLVSSTPPPFPIESNPTPAAEPESAEAVADTVELEEEITEELDGSAIAEEAVEIAAEETEDEVESAIVDPVDEDMALEDEVLAEDKLAVEAEPESIETFEPELESEEAEELGSASEDFSDLDVNLAEEGEYDETQEYGDIETQVDQEPEFLPENEIAEEAPVEPEPIAEIAEDDEAVVVDEPEFAPEEILEDEDDFDIAFSGAVEELDAEDTPVGTEQPVETSDETNDEKETVSGVGFDDWDDFGEIAAAEPEGEETEEGTDDGPEQPDLMGDIPEAEPKSKPKKQKGATTVIAQVLIGIGNKPYVRGSGPGLSETEGVPMEFLEIGKWQWVAPESDEPINVTIYKNDEVAAEGGPVEIPAGQRRSVSPKFPS
ncbi:MAG: hypothetical protein AAFX93_03330 [Verrucomicrobiota bacterium]